MKKILFLMAILPMMLFTACSNDDNENDYESQLVGTWIEDTESTIEVFHLELKSDKTGIRYATDDGEINEQMKSSFVWSATKNEITVIDKKTGDSDNLTYVLNGNHLQIESISYIKK